MINSTALFAIVVKLQLTKAKFVLFLLNYVKLCNMMIFASLFWLMSIVLNILAWFGLLQMLSEMLTDL